jgi:hypothetical protein
MRVVASHAASHRALLGVVRLFVGVTASAGLVGGSTHVMRGMAAGTLAVFLHAWRPENEHVLVARPAGDGGAFLEAMRLVTADTRRVTVREQSGGGHAGLFLGMTGRTSVTSLGSGRVLVLVARRAQPHQRLARRGVRRFHVAMTVGAGRGFRLRIGVRPVTIQAWAGAVNLDRWRLALRLSVAAHAIGCGSAAGDERVATGAVAGPPLCGVLDSAFFLVTFLAASRGDRPELAARERVALRARHLLLHNVCVVASGCACRFPGLGHVHTLFGRPVRVRAGNDRRERHAGDEPRKR